MGIQQCLNQKRWQMESSFPYKQRIIQTTSDVFQIIQFAWNISKNDEQYLLRIVPWRSISKLHIWLCHTSQDNGRTQRKDYSILKDCRETQSVFQMIKMQLYYGRNSNIRSCCWKETSKDGVGEDQSSQGLEDTNKDQRCGKLPRICKFLLKIYPKL